MTSSGPSRDIYAETLAVFDRPSHAHEPLTTTEVAEALDCTRRTVYKRLDKLVDRGDLLTKKVGSSARVWWRASADASHTTDDTEEDSEEDLQTERERFGALVQAVEEYAIFMLGPDGYIRSWNSGAERMKGYTEDEILGEHLETFYTDEDREAGVPRTNIATAAEEGVVEDEGWRVRKDGTTFWANATITAIRDDDGTLLGYAKVTRDMTERRERERQLRRERDKLEDDLNEVFERTTDGVVAIDDEWQITYVNEHAEELIGRSAGDLVGKGLTEQFPEEARGMLHEQYQEAMETQEPTNFEMYSDLVEGWVEVHAYPSPSGLSIYFRDITRRKEYEQELEQYQRIVETVDDGIYAVDSDARFVLVNDAFCELTGYDREELLGGYATMIHDEEVTPSAAELADEVAAGERDVATLELSIHRKDGETVPAESRLGPFPLAGERGRCGVIRDISDRVERERELEQQNERLESFASMLAHELRNPLTIGQMYTQNLPAETAPEAVGYITEAFDRIEDTIDILLALTQGRDAVGGSSEVELADTAREAWDEVDAPGATVAVEIDGRIQADETYIQHLFRNLFENTVEHGGSEVSVTVGELPTGFYVADDGRGIAAADREAVFKPGFTTAAELGGTGLGLAFVREMADVYGWTCTVTESDAGGAQFEFRNVDRSGGSR
ncbi:PAS domain S-box protein [Halomicrococcus sp. NG-SE-24]|uniref:PAS domain-containing protein n=1 Tax=Halomicrococcus sp. NG-SE-24 TaxID=3436928 RepID=UPI003D97479B